MTPRGKIVLTFLALAIVAVGAWKWWERFSATPSQQPPVSATRTATSPTSASNATVEGSGAHEKTGKHCMATAPNGKLNIARDDGYWMRDDAGKVTRKFKHICWDGCMFPNEAMMKPETWNNILAAMIQVRENHGWRA